MLLSLRFALESVDVEGNNLLHLCVRNNQKKTYDIIADAWTAWMTSIGVQHRTPLWLAPNKVDSLLALLRPPPSNRRC